MPADFDPPFAAPFASLASSPCPRADDMLIAVEREFRALDPFALDAALDELSLPLFGLADLGADECAGALAMAAHVALPGDGIDPCSWLLGCALDERRAAAPVRAGLAVELGRRAGVEAGMFRHRERWFVLVTEPGRTFVADVGPDTPPTSPCPRAKPGVQCSHALALEVLGGLAGAWREKADVVRARRASGLRLLLPVDGDERLAIQRDLEALDT